MAIQWTSHHHPRMGRGIASQYSLIRSIKRMRWSTQKMKLMMNVKLPKLNQKKQLMKLTS